LEENRTKTVSYPSLFILSIVEDNKRNLDEFEYTSQSIKSGLNQCKSRLTERTEKIALFGYQSKERIVLDEELKGMFKQAEDELAYLRDVFKRYQEKNKRKIAQKEIEARSKNIDLLRRNLNLLQDEFKEQVARMRKDMANGSGGRQQEGDFMNIFGINRSGSVRSEDNDYE
jgi:hypothetical protein